MLKLSFILTTLSLNSTLGYLLLHFSRPIGWEQHRLTWLKQIEVLEMDIWPLSDPKATQIISEEYYKNRQSDLACITSVCQMSEFL
jgi:hypothetical protein